MTIALSHFGINTVQSAASVTCGEAHAAQHPGLTEALGTQGPRHVVNCDGAENAHTTVCGEAHAVLSPLSATGVARAEPPAPAATAESSALRVLSRQVAELGLDIDDKRRVIDSYELRGFVHAHRTQFERALDHWRSLDEDLRPARPEPSEALEAAQLRLVEMQPRAEIAKVELAQLLRQDLAARDRLNSLVLAEANREADAAIEVLKTTIAAAAPAMTEIGKQARLIRSNFPQRADEALRLVDGARQLTW